MEISEHLLPHTCIITRRRYNGETDEFGNPVIEETALPPRRCRFARRNAVPREGGGYTVSCECIMQPLDDVLHNVLEGDTLTTSGHRCNGTYHITAISDIYGADDRIHHTRLVLQAITPEVR